MPSRKESPSHSNEPAKTQPKRRRKWLRRLVWLILLGAIGLTINGPIFRWALDKFPKDILRDNGLTAEYTVGGTLIGPWQINDVIIEDPKTGTDITISEIYLTLDWWKTIRREIAQPVNHVRITGANLTLDFRTGMLSQEAPATQEDDSTGDEDTASEQSKSTVNGVRSVFDTITKYIGHTKVDVDLEQLHIIAAKDLEWKIGDTTLTHEPGSTIELNIKTATLPDKEVIHDMGLTVDPINESINVRKIAIRNDLIIDHADISIVEDSLSVDMLASLFGGELKIDSPDLNVVNIDLKSGSVSIPKALGFVKMLTGVNVRIPSGSISKLQANVNLDGGSWPQGINGDFDLAVDDLITYGVTIGDAEININKTGQVITLNKLQVNTPGALVQITNAVTDATQFTTPRFWNQIPAENIRIDMRDLHDTLKAYRVNLSDNFPRIQGTVEASTSPAPDKKAMMPAATLTANIEPSDPKPALNANLKIDTDGHFRSPIDLELTVSQGTDSSPILKSSTKFVIDTLGYTTDTRLAIEQSDTVNTILQWLGHKPIGEIKTALQISGEGTANDLKSHKGSLRIDSLEFSRDNLFPVNGSATINYENAGITAHSLNAQFEGFTIDLAGNYARERVEISKLTVKHDQGLATLSASASLPLNEHSFSTPFSIITQSSPLALYVHFQSPNLKSITPLLRLAGLNTGEADIESGPIYLKANIGRTEENPLGFTIDANASKILIAKDPNQAPIDIKLLANSDNNAQLDATITYGDIGKLLAHGEMTWQPKHWANNPDDFLKENFTIDLKVDNMPVDFVKNLTDFVPEIDGGFTLKAKAAGTLETPEISGSARLDIDRAKFDTPYFPGVKDLRFAVALEESLVTITEGTFDSAGGDYRIGGTVDVSNIPDPVFDLYISCDQGLIFRNEAITARANTDLTLKGPLSDALLSGKVDIIQALYYREIRILSPSSTLGVNDGPALPKFEQSVENAQHAVETTPGILEAIKLDVQINSAEPIRVRSNLAQADIHLDVRAMNTLSKPQLDGKATIKNGSAQLPLSSLKIVDGKATFTPERGFLPTLSIHALSKPGRYRVNIYISGPAESPNVVMSSSPPLPQSEIYSLLATGSTREDLSGGGTAAVKAAMLLTREISSTNDSFPFKALNKVFDLVSELDVNIGETDRLTGRQSHSARISITDRIAIRVEYNEVDTSAAVIYEIPLK